ncbi:hypothetical protein C6P41_001773 [Kluyveromyces marxianus]|nr:hypothetical protein C6P41_001773 [Kluyveromyces marxianus]
MQGGVRRGNDLLPRYNTHGHGRGKGVWLTTPMKKIILYVMLLFTVFVVLQTIGIGKENEHIEYELERAGGSSGINRDALGSQMDVSDAMIEKAGSAASDPVPAAADSGDKGNAPAVGVGAGSVDNSKEEKKDLSNSAPIAAKNAQKSRNGVGNDIKADKQGGKGIDKKAQEIKEAAPYKKGD